MFTFFLILFSCIGEVIVLIAGREREKIICYHFICHHRYHRHSLRLEVRLVACLWKTIERYI